MSARQVAGLLIAGGALYALWRRGVINLPASLQTPPTAIFPGLSWPSLTDLRLPDFDLPGFSEPDGYTAQLVARESGGDLYAKNPGSTASGKYQFTKATWQRMGGAWGPNPSLPFGGLRPTEAEQDMRYRKLTDGNAAGLAAAGIARTAATLYAAHFLGLAGAVKVLSAPASAKLAGLVGSKVIAANPFLAGFTVADFRRWLEGRA